MHLECVICYKLLLYFFIIFIFLIIIITIIIISVVDVLKGLKKDTRLDDETGKAMPAIDVFALSIKCLKQKLEEMLETEGTGKQHYSALAKVSVICYRHHHQLKSASSVTVIITS